MLGVVMRAVIEELRVDFHEELHSIVYHAMNGPLEVVSLYDAGRAHN